jgi:uncharacterized OB-fold protein
MFMASGRALALTWRRIPERYNLIGTVCDNCGEAFFPPRSLCPNCRRRGRVRKQKFSGEGEIYSYTLVTAPPAGFELEAPYPMAVIQLKEGARVTAQLVETEYKRVKIGAPVEMVFRKIQEEGKEGLIHYGFKFKVVGDSAEKA